MRSLIIHADDFGLSEKLNEGIIRAHTDGLLTSASLIPVGSAFHSAVALSKYHPTLDLGIHLTLIEEKPLLPPEEIPSLVLKNGHFYPHAKKLFRQYLLHKISIEEVRNEFSKQIERVLDQGLQISHLDSHQHIHIMPKIFQVTVELAKKYNIRAIRIPNERLRFYMFKNPKSYSRLIQLLVVKTITSFLDPDSLIITDHFSGFFYGGRLNRNNLKKVIETLPEDGICELMCHPGLSDSDTRYSHWKYNWSDELMALSDSNIYSLIKEKGFTLKSYQEI